MNAKIVWLCNVYTTLWELWKPHRKWLPHINYCVKNYDLIYKMHKSDINVFFLQLHETFWCIQMTCMSLLIVTPVWKDEQNSIPLSHAVLWSAYVKIYTFMLQRLLNIHCFVHLTLIFPQKYVIKKYVRLSVKVTNKTKTKTCTYQVA